MNLFDTCPVCGYNELTDPPADWTICPCCRTKFGYSDIEWGVDLLRAEWIKAGAKWGSKYVTQPVYWSAIQQLLNINYHASDEEKIAIAEHSENTVDVFRMKEQTLSTSKSVKSVRWLSNNSNSSETKVVKVLPRQDRINNISVVINPRILETV